MGGWFYGVKREFGWVSGWFYGVEREFGWVGGFVGLKGSLGGWVVLWGNFLNFWVTVRVLMLGECMFWGEWG